MICINHNSSKWLQHENHLHVYCTPSFLHELGHIQFSISFPPLWLKFTLLRTASWWVWSWILGMTVLEVVITDFIFVLPTFLYCNILYSIFASGIIRAVKEKEVAILLKFSSLQVHLIQRFNSSGMLHYIWEEGCSLWNFLNLKMKALRSFETSVTIYSSPGHNISEDLNFNSTTMRTSNLTYDSLWLLNPKLNLPENPPYIILIFHVLMCSIYNSAF